MKINCGAAPQLTTFEMLEHPDEDGSDYEDSDEGSDENSDEGSDVDTEEERRSGGMLCPSMSCSRGSRTPTSSCA